MPAPHSLADWEASLRELAGSGPDAPPVGAPAPFALWMSGQRSAEAPPAPKLDEALWWALLDPSIDPFTLVEGNADGPLFDQTTSQSIEVWTERELCGLHALARLAQVRSRPDCEARAHACARWHVEHTQPDNATNRPWAAFVFLFIAADTGEHGARMYAETLVHNCQTSGGAPDPLSAMILQDSADAIAARLEARGASASVEGRKNPPTG